MMHTLRSVPPDTVDRRQVLLLWYWPRARGPHIHLGDGLPRARVLHGRPTRYLSATKPPCSPASLAIRAATSTPA